MEFDDDLVEEANALLLLSCTSSSSSSSSSQGYGARQRLIDSVLSRPNHLLLHFLRKRSTSLPNPGQAVLDYTKALFFVLGCNANHSESSKSATLLLQIVLEVLDIVHSCRLTVDRSMLDCLSFLDQELDTLPQRHLPAVSESILTHLESTSDLDEGHTLQLLPRCLTLITSSVDPVVIHISGEEDQLISGMKYRNITMDRMLRIPWSKTLLAKLSGILCEMPLDASQMVEFIGCIFQKIKHAELQDLPALTYQLLLLASKGFKRVILTSILSSFDNLLGTVTNFAIDSAKKFVDGNMFPRELGRQIQGTILLHINFAAKQDMALGQEILYLVRTGRVLLTPLVISVLLSIARIQRFEEPAMNLLKTSTLKTYQDYRCCR